MKKRMLSLLLILSILATLIVALPIGVSAATSGICGDNLTWSFEESTRTLTINGTGPMWDFEPGNSPWYLWEYVQSIVICDDVTSIGKFAFYECRTESVIIGDSVKTIGEGAFEFSWSLKNVTIGSSVEIIERRAFSDCYTLDNITIPDSVKTIGYDAFYFCENLTSINIPSGVIIMNGPMFRGCYNLKNITVDDNNKSFSSDSSGVLFNKDKTTLVRYPIGNERESYIIPDSVATIFDEAFLGCYHLTSIIVSESNKNLSSDLDGILYNKEKTTLIQYPIGNKRTDYTIPEGITKIGLGAFAYCYNLNKLTISKDVDTIYSSAFFSCYNLTEVIIPDGVREIGGGAFFECWGLKNITIPNSVTSMGDSVFSGCAINSINIPDGITDIGNNMFWNCSNLSEISIPDSVITIGEMAFDGCAGLKKIAIPRCVTTIGFSAFSNCKSLSEIIIPQNVKSIDIDAFYNCDNLTDVYYTGTEEEWNLIDISGGNGDLTSAEIHFNYIVETEIISLNVDSEGTICLKTANVPKSAVIYVASFDCEGRLLELKKLTLNDGIASDTFTTTDVFKYKAFIWEDDLKPLSGAKECKVQ